LHRRPPGDGPARSGCRRPRYSHSWDH
jgi:hypothetical protein